MAQKIVITEEFFNSLKSGNNATILREKGFSTPQSFINEIIAKLNNEFNFFEINGYRFPLTEEEKADISMYSAFIDGDISIYEKVVVFFTPIDAKAGNVIVEQGLMPTICTEMEKDIAFLINPRIKKVVVLTSKINNENIISTDSNSTQRDINSLNSLNFDVVSLFKIKNLSTDVKFNSLNEYLDLYLFLQAKNKHNSQYNLLPLVKNTLYGDYEVSQWQGQFPKSFCFKFLTAMLIGGNDYKYDISQAVSKLNGKKDRQLTNLKNFVDYVNNNQIRQTAFITLIDDDIVESDEEINNANDIHRKPEQAFDINNGRKRYKTQKKVRDIVLQQANYLCNCHDLKHFYFEAMDLNNYVEGHHIVPMNRQEEYYFGKNINLDIPHNIVALCPNCHSQIHLGSRQARLKILSELFVRNKSQLTAFDNDLSLAILASFYNIGLEQEEENDWLKRATDIVAKKHNKQI